MKKLKGSFYKKYYHITQNINIGNTVSLLDRRWATQHIRTQKSTLKGFRVQMGKKKKEVVFSYRIIQKRSHKKLSMDDIQELLREVQRSTDGRSQEG